VHRTLRAGVPGLCVSFRLTRRSRTSAKQRATQPASHVVRWKIAASCLPDSAAGGVQGSLPSAGAAAHGSAQLELAMQAWLSANACAPTVPDNRDTRTAGWDAPSDTAYCTPGALRASGLVRRLLSLCRNAAVAQCCAARLANCNTALQCGYRSMAALCAALLSPATCALLCRGTETRGQQRGRHRSRDQLPFVRNRTAHSM
jgi:hypothetical protein